VWGRRNEWRRSYGSPGGSAYSLSLSLSAAVASRTFCIIVLGVEIRMNARSSPCCCCAAPLLPPYFQFLSLSLSAATLLSSSKRCFFPQTPLALALVHRSSCVQRARTTAECCSARTRSLVSHFFFRSLGHHALSRYTALALKGCRSSEINANERLSHRPVKCMRPSV
jgi:hypothetical protein